MNSRFLFALFAIATPLVAGSYAPQGYLSPSASGIEELVHSASGGNPHAAHSITANAEAHPSPAEAARLGQVSAQVSALNANPTYNNLKNSESIAESLAENSFASNIRQGNVNIVSPNVVDQDIHRSLLVPSGPNNHQVIATQPLPPIIVNQPGSPPAQISSGPAAVVKAAPVIYKIKPSVIFQQEVINKVPTPLSLNPVYVKVYKPGKQIAAPTAPVLQQSFGAASDAAIGDGAGLGAGAGAFGSAAPTLAYASQAAPAYASHAAPGYASQGAPAYASQASSSYSSQAAPAYAQAPAYPQAGY